MELVKDTQTNFLTKSNGGIPDPSWIDRHVNDHLVTFLYKIHCPYPLNRPEKNNLGEHETEYTVDCGEMYFEFMCSKRYGLPRGNHNILSLYLINKAIRAVHEGKRAIEWKHASDILTDLGLPRNRQNYLWLKEGLLCIINTVSQLKLKSSDAVIGGFDQWIKTYSFWFDKKNLNEKLNSVEDELVSDSYDGPITKKKNYIELSLDFIEKVQNNKDGYLEEDLKMLRSLMNSPGALLYWIYVTSESKLLTNKGVESSVKNISDIKQLLGYSLDSDDEYVKREVKKNDKKVRKRFKEIYNLDPENHIKCWIEGNTVVTGAQNLMPQEVSELKYFKFSRTIDDYLNTFKTKSSKEVEMGATRYLISEGLSVPDIELALLEVLEFGDLRRRKIKKVISYLLKDDNFEKVLTRALNR